MITTARISECQQYRYELRRIWDDALPPCVFIGLNPSTADATQDDPTIRRCINFAKSWGMGSLVMVNAYAFRATDPSDMKKALDPIGIENNASLKSVVQEAADRGGIVIAAWGNHCDQLREVSLMWMKDIIEVRCLGKTKTGKPKHPLYIKSDVEPTVFWSKRS